MKLQTLKVFVTLFLLITAFITACGNNNTPTNTVSPTDTPTPTLTSITAPTFTPTPLPIYINDNNWNHGFSIIMNNSVTLGLASYGSGTFTTETSGPQTFTMQSIPCGVGCITFNPTSAISSGLVNGNTYAITVNLYSSSPIVSGGVIIGYNDQVNWTAP